VTQPEPSDRPRLVRHARYRWDAVREQHQIIFPEGMLVLNVTGAAIVKLCDGRTCREILSTMLSEFTDCRSEEVGQFLSRLSEKGLLADDDS